MDALPLFVDLGSLVHRERQRAGHRPEQPPRHKTQHRPRVAHVGDVDAAHARGCTVLHHHLLPYEAHHGGRPAVRRFDGWILPQRLIDSQHALLQCAQRLFLERRVVQKPQRHVLRHVARHIMAVRAMAVEDTDERLLRPPKRMAHAAAVLVGLVGARADAAARERADRLGRERRVDGRPAHLGGHCAHQCHCRSTAEPAAHTLAKAHLKSVLLHPRCVRA
eukprot:5693829-Prymnesium_polylepis.3